jgi:hypothetical protein
MVDDKQKEEALFMQLILTFQMAAWQQMGKVKNPMTDKIERNLEQARFSIDILEMIRKKTEGNLAEYEKQFLSKSISELQLNYIDEAEKEKKEKAQEETDKRAEEKKKDKQPEESKKQEDQPEKKEMETKKASAKKTEKSGKKQAKKK